MTTRSIASDGFVSQQPTTLAATSVVTMVRVAAAAACVLAVFAPAMGAPLSAATESVQAIKGSWSASVTPEFTSELQSSKARLAKPLTSAPRPARRALFNTPQANPGSRYHRGKSA